MEPIAKGFSARVEEVIVGIGGRTIKEHNVDRARSVTGKKTIVGS